MTKEEYFDYIKSQWLDADFKAGESDTGIYAKVLAPLIDELYQIKQDIEELKNV